MYGLGVLSVRGSWGLAASGFKKPTLFIWGAAVPGGRL